MGKSKEGQCNCPRHRPLRYGDTVRVDCDCGSTDCHHGQVGVYIGREINDKKEKDDLKFLVATLQTCTCCDGQEIIALNSRTKLLCVPDELPANVQCPIGLEIMQTPAYARGEPKMQRI